MKKKVMGIIAVIAIAAVAGYNVYTSQNDVKLSTCLSLLSTSTLQACATTPYLKIRQEKKKAVDATPM